MNKIKTCLLAAAVFGMASVASAGPLAHKYSNLFVFGDSIVDTGNTQALVLALTAGAADVTPAAAGYFEGRFTNGMNPADVINQAIEGQNLTGSLQGGDNYSFGGARARNNDAEELAGGGIPIPDLMVQVQGYLDQVTGIDRSGTVDSDALYLINVGGNDVRDILFGADAGSTIGAATAAIVTQVQALQNAGATEFLFMGVGDVGGIPEAQADPAGAAAGRLFSEMLNASIQAALAPLDIDFFDTIGFYDHLLPDLQSSGINLTDPCISAGVPDPVGAPSCEGYAFFDSVHPATIPLQLLGDEVVARLAQVPAPATLTLFALGVLGLRLSRRKAA